MKTHEGLGRWKEPGRKRGEGIEWSTAVPVFSKAAEWMHWGAAEGVSRRSTEGNYGSVYGRDKKDERGLGGGVLNGNAGRVEERIGEESSGDQTKTAESRVEDKAKHNNIRTKYHTTKQSEAKHTNIQTWKKPNESSFPHRPRLPPFNSSSINHNEPFTNFAMPPANIRTYYILRI